MPIRVNIAPDGTIRNCEVEGVGGINELNKLTCQIVAGKATFQPASIAGVPSFGVYRTSVTWAVADGPVNLSKVSNPDVDVTVEHLPAGLQAPTLVKVAFVVDALGRISSCMVDGAEGLERAENHPALVPIACEQVLQQYRAKPTMDATKKPIASVQNALVRFSEPPPPRSQPAQSSGEYHLDGPWESLGPADRVSRQEDYHSAHIDMASLVRVGGTIFVWAELESRRSGVDTALVRFEFDCPAKAVRVRAMQYRDKRRAGSAPSDRKTNI